MNAACGAANCAFNQDAIPGWTNGGSSGSFRPGNPANTNYFNSLPDGEILGYTNGSPIEQVVGATVQLGLTYTLMVDVGRRKDGCCQQTGTVALVIGNTEFAAPSVVAPLGGFATHTVAYTAVAADVGKTITIRLGATGAQGDFDNVRLADSGTASAIPEPGSALLVLAFSALAVFRSRRR